MRTRRSCQVAARVAAPTAVRVALAFLPVAVPAAEAAPSAAPAFHYTGARRVWPGVVFRTFRTAGPGGAVLGVLLDVDLGDSHVTAGLLHPPAVAAREPVSRMVAARHAVAGVNGDFFDIGDRRTGVRPTGSAVGPEVADGRALKAAVPYAQRFGPPPPPGTTAEEVIGVGYDRTARMTALHLTGTIGVHGPIAPAPVGPPAAPPPLPVPPPAPPWSADPGDDGDDDDAADDLAGERVFGLVRRPAAPGGLVVASGPGLLAAPPAITPPTTTPPAATPPATAPPAAVPPAAVPPAITPPATAPPAAVPPATTLPAAAPPAAVPPAITPPAAGVAWRRAGPRRPAPRPVPVRDGSLRIAVRGLNQYALPVGGVGVFTGHWGPASRVRAVCGTDLRRRDPCSGDAAEVTVRRGVVIRVANGAGGGPIPADTTVLVGREAGADTLRRLRPGDRVRVAYRLAGPARLRFAVGGFPVLRGGVPLHGLDATARAARTAAGLSRDGRRLYLLVAESHSARSTGLTLAGLAALLRAIGAADAMNLDGGGSSALVLRTPGEKAATLRNLPSAGHERAVANGIGVFVRP